MEVVATWWRDDKNFISDREVVAPPVQMLLKQSDFRTDLESAASSVTLIIITHTHLVSLLYTVTEEGSRGLEKAAINRIFLILPSRKEEREILFPFRLEVGAGLKKDLRVSRVRPVGSLNANPSCSYGVETMGSVHGFSFLLPHFAQRVEGR
ncbi:hypothetical protein YC2023_095026 [Brassica napus]